MVLSSQSAPVPSQRGPADTPVGGAIGVLPPELTVLRPQPRREGRLLVNGEHDFFCALEDGVLRIHANVFGPPLRVLDMVHPLCAPTIETTPLERYVRLVVRRVVDGAERALGQEYQLSVLPGEEQTTDLDAWLADLTATATSRMLGVFVRGECPFAARNEGGTKDNQVRQAPVQDELAQDQLEVSALRDALDEARTKLAAATAREERLQAKLIDARIQNSLHEEAYARQHGVPIARRRPHHEGRG